MNIWRKMSGSRNLHHEDLFSPLKKLNKTPAKLVEELPCCRNSL